ncbi:MAG: hypothetical protein ACO3XO_07395 [Bdellovibrionota bacterium]
MKKNPADSSYRAIAYSLLKSHQEKFGQAFERFYRPEIIRRQGGTLTRLAEEPLHLLEHSDTMGLADEQFMLSMKKRARELAEHLYHLAAKAWDRNINTYLKALDSHLNDYTCEEQRIFLKEVHQAFNRLYSGDLLERGESVDLLDQIVKRTGESTRTRLEKALTGVHIAELTEELWRDFFHGDSGKRQEIERTLLDLTEHQIRELRVAFGDYPATLLAKILREYLPPLKPPTENSSDEEETDNKPRKVYDFQLEAIRYLLKGRTPYEIRRIETVFNERARAANKPELRDHITKGFPLQLHEELLGLLEGETLKDCAARILTLLSEYQANPPKVAGMPQQISESLPSAPEKYHSFFWRRRLHHESSHLMDVELEAFQEIQAEVTMLSPFLFERLQEVLKEVGSPLSPRLYRRGAPVSPGRTAALLNEAITHKESKESILSLIAGFTPGEMARVRIAYQARYGQALADHLAPYFSGDANNDAYIHYRLSGALRAQFHVDLLAIFSPNEKQPSGSVLTTESFQERIHQAVAFLQQEKIATFAELKNRIKNIPPGKLYLLEAEFEETTGKRLRETLPVFSSPDSERAIALFHGTDIDTVVTAMLDNLEDAIEAHWLNLSTQETALLANLYLTKAKRSILTTLLERLTMPDVNTGLIHETLIRLLSVEARVIREELRALSLREENASTQPGECIFEIPYPALPFLEHAYSWKYGSLRKHLLSLVSDERISHEWFGKLIYRLEGIDSAIVDEIEIGLSEGDAKKLRMIFAELGYQCRTVDEIFLLENDDQSMKTAIMDMAGDEDERVETVLYFLGYYPDQVARLIEEALQRAHPREKEIRLREIFSNPFNSESPNPLLPNDLNWINEMYIQIRRRFALQTGTPLMPRILDSGISLDFSTELKKQLFGSDIALIVDELAGALSDTDGEEALAVFITSRLKESPPRYIRGICELFSALYPKESLQARLKKSTSEHGNSALEIMRRGG